MKAISAKIEPGDFDKFTSFVRRLVAVLNSEITAKLDAEAVEKKVGLTSAGLCHK